MAATPTVRRRIARGLAVATLAATALGGALAAPAAAASSQKYISIDACRDAQRAYGATSFVRITRSCYSFIPQTVGGVWNPDNVWYRFDYVTR
ncbi:hypothetical protein [Cellulomonas sp. S1-8]|uniref:hypothetical protein n=1 Tax=Cellulomonas sp. S1-8 TaxID=2904790 RepID=UPI002243F999|nr:hypothetical protein [Cellulomonas sp. S1-8]UZN03763.1 hypothetical protein OKX07_02125 [Cellulomonas sp. S1-8]